jgi:dolichol-phosphate mannosyltransferase
VTLGEEPAVSVLALLAATQVLMAVRVLARMIATAGGAAIRRETAPQEGRIAIVLPVLNERGRIDACLEMARAQTEEVVEIVVVDGGSGDGTPDLVRRHAAIDPRVRLVDASPVPPTWTGKAWGLAVGVARAGAAADWILGIDADVRLDPLLARSLRAHARRRSVGALSVAVRQRLSGAAEGLIHPALLATLIYRFGSPGHATDRVGRVQANGQCFLARRRLLERSGALDAARDSLCEDITIARRIAETGDPVGFYEAGDLAETGMYTGWRDTWRNWPRSLPMRDRYFGWQGAVGLVEVSLVQALPAPLLALAVLAAAPTWIVVVNGVLAATRLGVLAGMRRGYVRPPWTYWLSPLCDLPAAVRLVASAARRRHRWRDRRYVRRRDGGFECEEVPS